MSTPSELERQARQLADSLTEALRPVTEGLRAAVAPLAADPRLRQGAVQRELISDLLREVVGFEEPDDSAAAVAQNELAQERLETILAFIDLARHHSLPRKLLPRGDRPGQEFTPGEIVTVMGLHRGVVEPPYDEVRVKLDAGPRSAWPSWAIAREGEQWTPPNSTPH